MFQAESVRDAAFGCDWVGTPIQFQRCLMFIIATANKQFQLTAGKFVPVSNLTLVNVGKINILYFSFVGYPLLMGPGFLHVECFLSHSDTTLGRTPQDKRSARLRELYLYHDPGEIRTHHRSKRTAANPSFKPRGNRDILESNLTKSYN